MLDHAWVLVIALSLVATIRVVLADVPDRVLIKAQPGPMVLGQK